MTSPSTPSNGVNAGANPGGPGATNASNTGTLNAQLVGGAATIASSAPNLDNTQPNINALNQPPVLSTFVYSPEVRVVVAHGVQEYDVSKDLIRGSLIRQEGSAASFFMTLQNSGLRYTPANSAPLFSRMDRIVVFMKKTSWIQVFSGYLDQVPYKQLYPGPVQFKATCTIKRLMHTWWDPALQNNINLLNQFASASSSIGGAIIDTGLGTMLQTLLVEVGGWNPADIHIQNFPTEFYAFMAANLATLQGQGSTNMTSLETLLLGDNTSPGPGAYAGYNSNAGAPGSYAPTAATAGGLVGTPFYISQIVAACDDAGMGPTTNDNDLGAALIQAGATGATSASPFSNPSNQQAWDQVQQTGQSIQSTNRNSDAAILGVATAMTETGNGAPIIANLANLAVIGSDAFGNDGYTTNGTCCGIMLQQSSVGNVAQRMNPKQAAAMFFSALSTNVSGWRNLDAGAACQQVQLATSPVPYDANIETATSMVQAYRASLAGPASAVTSVGIPGTNVATTDIGQAAAGLGGAPSQAIGTALGGAASVPVPLSAAGTVAANATNQPQPNSEGAINFMMTCIGQPYVWGGTGPLGYDCLAPLTKVLTERGEVFIKDLTCEDRVLTRQGYRRVLAAWKVKDAAAVVSVTVNGRKLTGTPDHRVWTENRGWVRLKYLRSSDTLVACHTHQSKSFASTVVRHHSEILVGNSAHASARMLFPLTKGLTEYVSDVENSLLEGFTTSIAVMSVSARRKQRIKEGSIKTTSRVSGLCSRESPTIATQTPQIPLNETTIYGHSDHCTLQSGSTITVPSPRDMKCIISITTPSITTSQTCCASPFPNTDVNRRQHDDHALTPVHSVVKSSSLLSEITPTDDSVVLSIDESFTTEVWDIMVEDVHEFFANGVLVHNCSGLQYMGFRAIGIDIGRTTQAIASTVQSIPQTAVQRGDLIEPTQGHVVMWLGDGTVLEAQQQGVPIGIYPNSYGLPGSWAGAYRACLNGGINPTAPFNPPQAMGPGTPPSAIQQVGGSSVLGSSATGSGGAQEGIARNLFTFQFNPGQFISQVAGQFTGIRAFIEGQPLIQMVSAIAAAGLRTWMSGPDGSIIFWYPDYWGWDGKPAVMSLADIEMKDCTINFSDDSLSTHVYINGSTTMGLADTASTELAGWLSTAGIVTVEQPWLFNLLVKWAPGDLDAGIGGEMLMQQFGVRPYRATFSCAGAAELEFIIACQVFMQKWAEQYKTTISMTFMPELFPGMRVSLQNHNLEVYVAGVQHNFDFEQGFTTDVTIMAPGNPNGASLSSSVNTAVDPNDPTMSAFTNAFGTQVNPTPNANATTGAGSAGVSN